MQYSMKTLCFVVLIAASLCGSYRLGYYQAGFDFQNARETIDRYAQTLQEKTFENETLRYEKIKLTEEYENSLPKHWARAHRNSFYLRLPDSVDDTDGGI